jgi:hypothetical protein
MSRFLRFPASVKRDPAVDVWIREHSGELGAIARRWFEVMRSCGDDVRELLHDGQPTACVGDAAFGYVDAFKGHVNVGFFLGARIADPGRLLEGTGKHMRHVKLGPGRDIDAMALRKLIETAYTDMRARLEVEALVEPPVTKRRELARSVKTKLNRAWHARNRMPPGASRAVRLEWHLRHAQHCACRPMPASLQPEVEGWARRRDR